MNPFNISIFRLFYLAFRLGPFLLVAYFMIFSLFHQDYSNLILFVGVIMACFFTIVVGAALPKKTSLTPDMVCSPLRLPSGERLSGLPLSLAVYTYIYCYFAVPIFEEKLQSQNVLFLCFFPLLILFDILWLRMFQCASYIRILLGGLVGLTVGLSWGEIVYQMDMRSIQSESKHNQCHKPTPVAIADISSKEPNRYLCVKRWRTKVEPITKPPVESFQNPFKESLQGGFKESLQGVEGLQKRVADVATIRDVCKKSSLVLQRGMSQLEVDKNQEVYATVYDNYVFHKGNVEKLMSMSLSADDKMVSALFKFSKAMVANGKKSLSAVESEKDTFPNEAVYNQIMKTLQELQQQYERLLP